MGRENGLEGLYIRISAPPARLRRIRQLPFLEAVASDDTRVFDVPADHFGSFLGPDAYETYWPQICDWVEECT